ncbi:hypothetical protein F511_46862 [Dorcoceras hygrometricum]|uniref:Uncharacterized protein n=1 Tax=Dorcoceras hygrometricum TaxID=472368 RepID=A0A2Z6ZZ76_9LAMI|nr:hypothetical protein F511_46862 [Dorcoceras hygrometricum]
MRTGRPWPAAARTSLRAGRAWRPRAGRRFVQSLRDMPPAVARWLAHDRRSPRPLMHHWLAHHSAIVPRFSRPSERPCAVRNMVAAAAAARSPSGGAPSMS